MNDQEANKAIQVQDEPKTKRTIKKVKKLDL
jgi:hypothetical protein